MHIRDFVGRFAPMDSEVANFHLKAERNHVKTADLDATPSRPLDPGNQAAANHLLKRVCIHIPEKAHKQKQECHAGEETIAPNSPQVPSPFGHCSRPCASEEAGANVLIWA